MRSRVILAEFSAVHAIFDYFSVFLINFSQVTSKVRFRQISLVKTFLRGTEHGQKKIHINTTINEQLTYYFKGKNFRGDKHSRSPIGPKSTFAGIKFREWCLSEILRYKLLQSHEILVKFSYFDAIFGDFWLIFQ